MTQAHNLCNIDYRVAGQDLQQHPYPIIDFHAHIHGGAAAQVYGEAAAVFGVGKVYSMTTLEELDAVRGALGERLELIAFPIFRGADPLYDHGKGYVDRIKQYYKEGARIVKFWAAPRGRDFGEEWGDDKLLSLDTPARREAMDLACSLGMSIMVHVADPNTWFKTIYHDETRYGSKAQHYEALERLIELYPTRWIAAHMGGSPEDLHFLSTLLDRYDQLYLDTSAAKWIVREISRHPRAEVLEFFQRWSQRLLFGSDIVTADAHLSNDSKSAHQAHQASSREEAFNLYASRYYVLRTLWETTKVDQSPILDPDLELLRSHGYACEGSSPQLRGVQLPAEFLQNLYHDVALTFEHSR